jgi:murein DD-endopeptidase MepM/ murein hydrolase activator NlpD
VLHRFPALNRAFNRLTATRYFRTDSAVDLATPAASATTSSAHRATGAAAHPAAHPHGFSALLGFLLITRRQLTVGTAVVTMAFAGVSAVPAVAAPVVQPADPAAFQTFDVEPAAYGHDLARDGFAVTHFTPVTWPIPSASSISSGWGPRRAPCRGCSSFHEGLDFTPGAGTPVHAIADGVVVEAGRSGALGWHAFIQHNVNGEIVTSGYGHMQRGSMNLSAGQTVAMGQVIGAVGNTGASTGAHLHFILEHGSAAFDPLPWLRSHVNS